MATYAIGDIQGCYKSFRALLKKLSFSSQDHLWLVGDLVNKGPQSADVLRWMVQNQDRVTAVLGNHDLWLLSCALGGHTPKSTDTFQSVLEAPDVDELVQWLRGCSVAHVDSTYSSPHVLVHAGILPNWDLDALAELNAEISKRLTEETGPDFLRTLGTKPRNPWSKKLRGENRALAALSVLTRVRILDQDHQMVNEFSGPLAQVPDSHKPWFESLRLDKHSPTYVFGHWAALGLYQQPHIVALDSGCVYGRELTAYSLEDKKIIQVENQEH